MPILDCRRGAVFENAINDHRLKSTESTVYLNNQVENGLFTLINGAFVEDAALALVKSVPKFTRLFGYSLHLDNLMRA